jgi:hypothetical protein
MTSVRVGGPVLTLGLAMGVALGPVACDDEPPDPTDAAAAADAARADGGPGGGADGGSEAGAGLPRDAGADQPAMPADAHPEANWIDPDTPPITVNPGSGQIGDGL